MAVGAAAAIVGVPLVLHAAGAANEVRPAEQATTRPAGLSGDDWPCWRGPKGDGLPTVTSIRTNWTGGLEKLWEVSDLCRGTNSATWSAPAIRGDKLIVPGRHDDKDGVYCLDARKGTRVWHKEYPTAKAQVQYGNGPRASAAIDGELAYTFGCMGHLVCWKMANGERVWMQEVDKLGGQRPFYGHSSSPLVWKETVIVQGGGNLGVVAFNKKTGEVAWKSGAGRAGYAAPAVVTVARKPQLLVFMGTGLVALDPENGAPIWKYAHPTQEGLNCCTPVPVGEDRLLIASPVEYGPGGAALLQLGAGGPREIWKSRDLSAGHNDPVVVGGYAYAFCGFSLNNKELRCVDMADGKLKWRTDAVGGPGTVVLVDGLLLCLGNRGKLALVRPSPEKFCKIAEFDAIKANPVWTVPVLTGDRLYIRFCNRLICYRIKASLP